MKTLLFLLLLIGLFSGCQDNEENDSTNIKIKDGFYMGYFVYNSKDYWCEIEFDNYNYIEWPSGGALFQKSMSCLTVGTYRISNDKLTFNLGSFKFPEFQPPCESAMLLPGEYKIYNTGKADSLIFEKGVDSNKIKYFLKRIPIDN